MKQRKPVHPAKARVICTAKAKANHPAQDVNKVCTHGVSTYCLHVNSGAIDYVLRTKKVKRKKLNLSKPVLNPRDIQVINRFVGRLGFNENYCDTLPYMYRH